MKISQEALFPLSKYRSKKQSEQYKSWHPSNFDIFLFHSSTSFIFPFDKMVFDIVIALNYNREEGNKPFIFWS